jgi:SAM-dependent methyltransferase
LLPELARAQKGKRDCQDKTRRSFGAQWELHDNSKVETTWGVTVEERIDVVLHELDWRPDDLEDKVILDAGCGNGTLSAALAERGATVVALDLSESVFRAELRLTHPRLHFVQGNLFFPPFRAQVFDAIYSCGVFHHTPDTRRCFDALVRTLKQDMASRYFVWLYAKRSRLFNATVEHAMKITRRLPSNVLVPACVTLAGPVEAAARVCTAAGWTEDAPRSLRDRAIQLHDLLSPTYVRYHTFDEAWGWAREQGFEDVSETSYRANGHTDSEHVATLEKYRKICRPGFGMLCRSLNRAAESVS